MYILALETSTRMCSVALFDGEQLLVFHDNLDTGYTHAEKLHVLIAKTIDEAGIKSSDLQAIAVGKGPGSYTGLRIGVSAAKGMAYALDIPLLAVDSLQIMASAIPSVQAKGHLLLPMTDARRMEVYTAIYDEDLTRISEIQAEIIHEQSFTEINGRLLIFGDGAEKCVPVLNHLDFNFIPNIWPSARFMGKLSFELYKSNTFEDIAYFEPYYLKEFIAGKSKST